MPHKDPYRYAVDVAAIFSETDLAGRITYVNDKFCEVSGYSADELLGANHRMLQSGQHPRSFFVEMWQAIAAGQVWQDVICNRRKDGTLYWVDSTIVGIRDSQTGQIKGYASVRFDITERYNLLKRLEFQAFHDSLTHLHNRQALRERFTHVLKEADSAGELVGVCMLDLDNFKTINDQHGHEFGDRLLCVVAQRLISSLRPEDMPVRMGGDEFAILFTRTQTEDELHKALGRVLSNLSMPYTIQQEIVFMTASAGIAVYPHDHVEPEILLRHADQALYESKLAGRNQFHVFDVDRAVSDSFVYQMSDALKKALAHNELVLHYQPKLDLRSLQVVGLEALVRWQHPDKGLLPPGVFLPHVEHSPFILELGDWVMEQALTFVQDNLPGGTALPVSVNIAPRHFQHPQFAERLRFLLARFPSVPPQFLDLEILETVIIEDFLQVRTNIEACRALGVTLSLDDFGTGYSSLSYLKNLNVHTLKIDRSFITDILNNDEDRTLTQAIIDLARRFGITVVAEGVETDEHLRLLTEMGCDVAQGFGIARPMPAPQLLQWLKQRPLVRSLH